LKQRVLRVLVIVAVFVVALWWISRAPGKLVGDELVEATVVAVEMRGRGPDRQTGAPVLVTVELADGGRAQLWLSPPGPARGQPLQVRVRRYEDGTRRVGAAR